MLTPKVESLLQSTIYKLYFKPECFIVVCIATWIWWKTSD